MHSDTHSMARGYVATHAAACARVAELKQCVPDFAVDFTPAPSCTHKLSHTQLHIQKDHRGEETVCTESEQILTTFSVFVFHIFNAVAERYARVRSSC